MKLSANGSRARLTATLVGAVLAASAAMGAERIVLSEQFTATW